MSSFALFAQCFLAYWQLSCFQVKFRVDFSIFVMNNVEILMEIISKMKIAFANIAILIILILPIHNMGDLSIFHSLFQISVINFVFFNGF
jgi:hypothetical protein